MKNPTIWCVVPFSRPHQLQWVVDLFKSQTYHNKKLLIVENGQAVGACKKAGIEPDVILTSRPHQSYAKNEALLYLKDNGFGDDIWTTWDDDDYYGPVYLEEIASNIHKGDIVGKTSSFMRLTDGRLYCLTKWPENAEAELPFIHGPTVTGRVKESILFTYMDWGEDLVWVREMAGYGAKIYRTSRYHWCYFRYPNTKHTWLISDNEIMIGNSGHMFFMSGMFEPDIVNGTCDGLMEPVKVDLSNMEESPVIGQIKRETGDMVNTAIWRAAQIMKKWPDRDKWAPIDDESIAKQLGITGHYEIL
jgi:glycosyltransferase involved in cell wall biosynthesis